MPIPGGFEVLEHARMQDAEAERIGEFMMALLTVTDIKPILPDTNFDDVEPIYFAEKRFLAFDYSDQPTLYLNPDLGVEIQGPQDLSFTPLVARGGKRSAHGVFFGRLRKGEDEISVAVKPHTANAFITGLDDYFKNHAISELGFYSLKPAGLLLASREKAYSMTVLEEGLTTLDSIDWSHYYPNAEENPGMQEMWRVISDQAAILHAMGNKTHGDMAARNIATNTDGLTFFIDWEHAQLSNNKTRDAETRYSRSYADLSVLLESMCLPPHADIGGKAGIGMFYGKKCDWWKAFCEVFFDEYVAVRLTMAEDGNHHGQALRDVNEELKQLEIDLREDVRMMKDICDNIPPLPRSPFAYA